MPKVWKMKDGELVECDAGPVGILTEALSKIADWRHHYLKQDEDVIDALCWAEGVAREALERAKEEP